MIRMLFIYMYMNIYNKFNQKQKLKKEKKKLLDQIYYQII